MKIRPPIYGPLARRLRLEAGVTLRELGRTLDVSHVAVTKAEGGNSALVVVAVRSVAYLLCRLSGERVYPPEDEAVLHGGSAWEVEGKAAAYLESLLHRERGWRRALVRGVMEEHGYVVETDHATATARFPNERSDDNESDHSVLTFSLDDGFVDATVEGKTTRLRPIVTNPFERADRESWGEDLEQVAVVFSEGDAGWAERDPNHDTIGWVIGGDDDTPTD